LLAQPSTAQVLETETARLRIPGSLEAGFNYEFQTCTEGQESAVPFLFEYGFNDRLGSPSNPLRQRGFTPISGRGRTASVTQR